MLPLAVRPEAEWEIESVFWWYETQCAGLGHEFMRNLDSVFQNITENPFGSSSVAPETRRAVVRRFPYVLCYVVEEHRILVTGLFHAHRSPLSWSDRLREESVTYAVGAASAATKQGVAAEGIACRR